MIPTNITYFDVGVLCILALSCMFAFFRGLVKEILSLGAWVGAGVITIYWFPDVAKELQPHFKTPVVAAGIATLGLYITALLCFSMINALILRFVKEGSEVGVLDNSLGLIFGAARGAFIVCLGYFMITMAMKEDEYPPWIKGAHTRPAVEKGAVWLARIAPDYLTDISSLHDKIEKKKETAKKADKENKEGEAATADGRQDRLKQLFSKEPAR